MVINFAAALEQLASQNVLMFEVPGGKRFYSFSGIAVTNIMGPVNDLARGQLSFALNIPDLPESGAGFIREAETAFAGLQSIFVGHDAAGDLGWAVDNCRVQASDPNGSRQLEVIIDLAVRGRALIKRIAYQIQILGRVVH
jgi:hypothetical protein